MKKSILFLGITFLGIMHFSCKKEDQNLSKTELLTSNTWKIVSKALTPPASMGGITIDDVMILDSDDQRNFSYKFNSDGTVIEYNKLNEEIFRTNWEFNADETKITYAPGIVYSYPIVGDYTLTMMDVQSITKDKIVANVVYTFAGTEYLGVFTYEPK